MTQEIFKPGQRVASGKYKILRSFRTGGMSDIFEVADTETGYHYALKIPDIEAIDKVEYLERFKLEIEILTRFDHPNILKVIYHDTVRVKDVDIPYFVMNLYHLNLAELINAGIDVSTGLRIMSGVLQALDYAHSRNIFHRDLKPSNILVTTDRMGILTDFGIAKSNLKDITKLFGKKGMVMGTVEYMSPEQITNKEITFSSDIYSVGVLLYKLTTGEYPFKATNDLELMRMHLEKKPDPPSSINPLISRNLDEIVLKCLEKKPEKRFQSAKDILYRLRDLQEFTTTALQVFKGGEIIGDERFKIIELYSTGGISEIYKVENLKNNQILALKILSMQSANDKELVERFNKEIQILNKLENENIVKPVYNNKHKINDLDIDYYIMPFFPGNFKEEIKNIPLIEGLRVLLQIAGALEYSAKHGVYHRDVKPSNILIDSKRKAYLTDFGIAKLTLSESDLTGRAALGTSGYMSPEQIMSQKIDERSDIYSFGVILYELIAGSTPFASGSDVETITRHLKEKPVPPKKFNPIISNRLQNIIMKCLEKKPEDRYQRFSELIKELEAQSKVEGHHSKADFSKTDVLETIKDGFQGIKDYFTRIAPGKKDKAPTSGFGWIVPLIVFIIVGMGIVFLSEGYLLSTQKNKILGMSEKYSYSKPLLEGYIKSKLGIFQKSSESLYSVNFFRFFSNYSDLKNSIPDKEKNIRTKLQKIDSVYQEKLGYTFPSEFLQDSDPTAIAEFEKTLKEIREFFNGQYTVDPGSPDFDLFIYLDQIEKKIDYLTSKIPGTEQLMSVESPKSGSVFYSENMDLKITVLTPKITGIEYTITKNESPDWLKIEAILPEPNTSVISKIIQVAPINTLDKNDINKFNLYVRAARPNNNYPDWNPDYLKIPFVLKLNASLPVFSVQFPNALIQNNTQIPEGTKFFIADNKGKSEAADLVKADEFKYTIKNQVEQGIYTLVMQIPNGQESKFKFVYDTTPPQIKNAESLLKKKEYFKNETVALDFQVTDNVSSQKNITREFSLETSGNEARNWQKFSNVPINIPPSKGNILECKLFIRATDESGNVNIFPGISPVSFRYYPESMEAQFRNAEEFDRKRGEVEKLINANKDLDEVKQNELVKDFPEASIRIKTYIEKPYLLSEKLAAQEKQYLDELTSFLNKISKSKSNYKDEAHSLLAGLTGKHKQILGDKVKNLEKAIQSNDFSLSSQLYKEIRFLIDFITPTKVTTFKAVEQDSGIRLNWTPSTDPLDSVSGQTSGLECYIIIYTFKGPEEIPSDAPYEKWAAYKQELFKVYPTEAGMENNKGFLLTGIKESKEYNIGIWAQDIQENKSPTNSSVLFITPKPRELSAKYDKESGGIKLAWNIQYIEGPLVNKYKISIDVTRQKKNSPGESIKIVDSQTPFQESFFDNKNLEPGTEYVYTIKVKSGDNKAPSKSATVEARTP